MHPAPARTQFYAPRGKTIMLDAGTIGYDLAILAKNVSTMKEHADGMLDPSAVEKVTGGGEDTAQVNYTARLEQVMTHLGLRIEKIRSFVTANAEALNTAAAALEATDSEGDQAAAQATEFIDSIVASTPAGSGTPGNTGNGANSGGSTGNTDGGTASGTSRPGTSSGGVSGL